MASPTTNGNVATPPPVATQPTPPTTQPSAIEAPAPPSILTPVPADAAISSADDGTSLRRPRDARLIHILLAAQGVNAYQERVPLMLMDFAYRYTSGILSDAQAITSEAGAGGTGKHAQEGSVNFGALRQAVSARNHFQIQPQLTKEDMQELALEVNRVALPKADRDYGLRLPSEKYCLTGIGFGLKEDWAEEETVDDEEKDEHDEEMKDANAPAAAVEGGSADDEDIDQDDFEDAMGGDTTMQDS